MVYETGLLVGGISIVTACVAKLKCYVQTKRYYKLGLWIYGCPIN